MLRKRKSRNMKEAELPGWVFRWLWWRREGMGLPPRVQALVPWTLKGNTRRRLVWEIRMWARCGMYMVPQGNRSVGKPTEEHRLPFFC